MTTNRYNIRPEHLGPDAEESDMVRYIEYLEQAGIEPGDDDSMRRAWEVFCSSGSFEAAAAELARIRGEVGETDLDRAKPER